MACGLTLPSTGAPQLQRKRQLKTRSSTMSKSGNKSGKGEQQREDGVGDNQHISEQFLPKVWAISLSRARTNPQARPRPHQYRTDTLARSHIHTHIHTRQHAYPRANTHTHFVDPSRARAQSMPTESHTARSADIRVAHPSRPSESPIRVAHPSRQSDCSVIGRVRVGRDGWRRWAGSGSGPARPRQLGQS